MIAGWPGIGLWFFGAMLVCDLIFSGWSFLAFGVMLKMRASHQQIEQVHG